MAMGLFTQSGLHFPNTIDLPQGSTQCVWAKKGAGKESWAGCEDKVPRGAGPEFGFVGLVQSHDIMVPRSKTLKISKCSPWERRIGGQAGGRGAPFSLCRAQQQRGRGPKHITRVSGLPRGDAAPARIHCKSPAYTHPTGARVKANDDARIRTSWKLPFKRATATTDMFASDRPKQPSACNCPQTRRRWSRLHGSEAYTYRASALPAPAPAPAPIPHIFAFACACACDRVSGAPTYSHKEPGYSKGGHYRSNCPRDDGTCTQMGVALQPHYPQHTARLVWTRRTQHKEGRFAVPHALASGYAR
ncbi:hypothetical protein COCMIDRAFT_26818 [Bipolaris oryzae ATCC 44560]|uniref:Uncharacterized protein n=1 Tax=Bipolaris oryzae ATCC 44560 TaxID=930090 RepID=W6Z5B6_COCMI|nr:uncharacterized protein COCMIDRAFT_26818 [Bipolaris oryzae ATCC 44560]EUC44958.1 hypothetical protein COCMIDRAFT_26818 [Bipolaris oryzae ATCC 44560]